MLGIEHLTVDNLNELTAGQASLVLLRILNTSDLSFFHSLFKKETLEDILSVTDDMVRMESEEGLFDDMEGYRGERSMIQDEIDQQKNNPHMNKHELRIAEMEAEAEQEDPEYDANGEPNDGYIDGRKGF